MYYAYVEFCKINKPLIGKKTKNLTQSVVSFEIFSIFGKIKYVLVKIEYVLFENNLCNNAN